MIKICRVILTPTSYPRTIIYLTYVYLATKTDAVHFAGSGDHNGFGFGFNTVLDSYTTGTTQGVQQHNPEIKITYMYKT